MNGYILAVDTGGSKTQLSLFDLSGNQLSNARCKGIGVSYGAEAPLEVLSGTLNGLMTEKAFSEVRSIVINVGGANTEEIRKAFAFFFPSAQIRVFRESSGVIMSELCEIAGADAILMAGTGTIALAKGKNGNIITDGWCPNVGDWGSGYHIGLEAISRSVKALETDVALPPLAKYITGRNMPFKAVSNTEEQMILRDEVRSHFMPLERADVAKLTQDAARYAREGDEMAINIFVDAGKALAQTTLRGIKLADCNENARVLVSGGLTKCVDLWGPSFEKTLQSENKKYSWFVGYADMIKGALHYALKTL